MPTATTSGLYPNRVALNCAPFMGLFLGILVNAPSWQPNYAYSVGATITDSNGNIQMVTSAGSPPTGMSGVVQPGTTFDITSAAPSGSPPVDTTYEGTFTSTNLAGLTVVIAGFTHHITNNGTFTIISNTTSALIVNNAQGAIEPVPSSPPVQATATATIQPNWSTTGTTVDGGLIWTFQEAAYQYFNPMTDLGIYIDGDVMKVESFNFDSVNNRYLMYASTSIDVQGVIQVVYHMPAIPFTTLGSPPGILGGFALIGTYSPTGL